MMKRAGEKGKSRAPQVTITSGRRWTARHDTQSGIKGEDSVQAVPRTLMTPASALLLLLLGPEHPFLFSGQPLHSPFC